MPRPHLSKGFSLIELSIVLVIMGILVGAVIAGSALIRSSEMRSVLSDVQKIKSGIATFEERYGALPGDITNATTLWSAGGTANGNGNGMINGNLTAAGNPESLRAWQHLSLAQMISGTFTGTSAGAAPFATYASESTRNIFASKLRSGFYYLLNAGDVTNVFDITKGNFIHFGSIASDNSVAGGVLTPTEAIDIDKKIDDGIANQGNVYGANSADYAGGTGCSTDASVAAGADYNKLSTAIACRLFIWMENKKQ